MEIALISVLGAGLVGWLGVTVQHLLAQNAQRAKEHKEALQAIAEQGQLASDLHTQAMKAITEQSQEMHNLHTQAMKAITEQSQEMHNLHTQAMKATQDLHTQAMQAIAEQKQEMHNLHTQAMKAILSSDRENRKHREQLHAEAMKQTKRLYNVTAALGERTAALEAAAGLWEPSRASADPSGRQDADSTAPRSAYAST